MTVIGAIRCDRCGDRTDAPAGGSYPQDWGAITFKMSRPPETRSLTSFRDKKRWYHICPKCCIALQDFLCELTDQLMPLVDKEVETGG